MTQPPDAPPPPDTGHGTLPATKYEPPAAGHKPSVAGPSTAPPTEYEPPADVLTVPPTEHEPGAAPPTEHEPGAAPHSGHGARSGGSGPQRRGDTRRLPTALRDRFRLRAVLRGPDEPHRAAVYRVEDDAGLHILKWYDRAHAPDPEVLRILGERPRPHLLHVTETDPAAADGHPYDLAPSYGETDLAAYLADNPGPVEPAFVRSVVQQLHEALTTVHELGLVHRDVSPANIMLSTLDPTDPHLVLVDFGVSSAGREEPYTTRDDRWVGTTAYMSPQAMLRNQLIDASGDWWSLGMIVAEMAGGQHPMYPLTDPDYIRDAIVSRGPDLSRVTEQRLLLLCLGLLTLDYDHRWGSAEVAEWLAGGSPRVAHAHSGSAPGWPEPPQDPGIEPFAFLGGHFTRPPLLAQAFGDNWRAAGRLLGGRASRERLAGWLRQFDGTGAFDSNDLATAHGLLENRPRPTTLVRLISCLGPRLGAAYRGVPLDVGGLTELVRHAAADDEFALSVVADLRAHTILPLLAHRPGGAELDAVQQRWLAHRARWESLVEEVTEHSAVLQRDRHEVRDALHHGQRIDVDLLEVAATPAASRRRLGDQADGVLADLDVPVEWYRRLVADHDDLTRLYLAARLAEFARGEAREQLMSSRTAVRDALVSDGARQWLRRQETLPTLGWAAGGALALILPWIFVIGLSDLIGRPAQQTVLVAWMLAVPGAASVLALELWTAYRIGSPDYHPDLSLAGLVTRGLQRPARFIRVRHARFPVRSLLVLFPLGLLWLTVAYAAWAWPVGTVTALAWWTWYRLRLRRRRRAAARHALRTTSADRPPGAAFDQAGDSQ